MLPVMGQNSSSGLFGRVMHDSGYQLLVSSNLGLLQFIVKYRDNIFILDGSKELDS